jgi:hypothetical protein
MEQKSLRCISKVFTTCIQDYEVMAKDDEAIGSLLSCWDSGSSFTEDIVKHFYHEDSDMYKCEVCEKPETKQMPHRTCGRCKSARYCNRECQVAHWKQHKATCKILSSDPPTAVTEDSQARSDAWKEKYKSLLQLATFWELKEKSSDGMICVVNLEDLPESCSYPRFGIKSFRQQEVTDFPDFVQQFRSEMLQQAPDDCDRVEFALLLCTQANGEPMASMLPFIYDGEDEDSNYAWANLSRTERNVYFHAEALKYINTISEMATGGNESSRKLLDGRKSRQLEIHF